MRLIDKISILVMLIAGGLVYLAEQFEVHRLIPIAIGLFGLFAFSLGVDTFMQGKIQMFDRLYSRSEYYSGAPARLLAIIIFLFGVGLTSYAVWEWVQPGAAGAYLAGLVGSARGWGILLLIFGIFMTLFGILRLVTGSAWKKDEQQPLVDFGFRLRGLISLALGILLILGGLWLFFE